MEKDAINIPQLVVKSHEPKDVVAFVAIKLEQYNRRAGKDLEDRELALYIDILYAAAEKLGSKKKQVIL